MNYIHISAPKNEDLLFITNLLNQNNLTYKVEKEVERTVPEEIMAHVWNLTCKRLKENENLAKGKCRKKNLVYARNIFIYIMRESYPNIPFKMIAWFLSGRDHTSIVHSYQVVHNSVNGKFKHIPENQSTEKIIKEITACI